MIRQGRSDWKEVHETEEIRKIPDELRLLKDELEYKHNNLDEGYTIDENIP